MRSTPVGEMCEHHCKYITIRKIVLSKEESHCGTICRGEVRRVKRQCTARGNVDLRDVNEDRRNNKWETDVDAVRGARRC